MVVGAGDDSRLKLLQKRLSMNCFEAGVKAPRKPVIIAPVTKESVIADCLGMCFGFVVPGSFNYNRDGLVEQVLECLMSATKKTNSTEQGFS